MAEALLKNPESFPTLPGVYLFKNGSGNVLYVGKSTNLRERIKSHLFAKGEKAKALATSSKKIEYIPVNYELEALLLEAALIKRYLPRYNSRAKDDKHPLYIKITIKEKFPKIGTSRLEDKKNAIYFGPFPSSSTTRQVLKDLRKIFPYCAQKNIGKKPCFYSHIGLCNPCPAAIVKAENKLIRKKLTKLYQESIKRTVMILSGEADSLIGKLKKEMKTAVKKEDFEKAAKKRDKLKDLSYITTSYKPPGVYLKQPDFIEDLRRTELTVLQKLLAPFFPGFTYPHRVEYIDISHLAGDAATASLVVFINGEPEKNLYRRFRVRGKETRNDYWMMKEILRRRLGHLKDWGKPDLIVLDGGKPQVSAGKEILSEAKTNIPLIGFAKRFEEAVLYSEDKFHIVRLKDYLLARNLLRRLENEAHRFARGYHFKLRLKEILATGA